MSSHALLPNFGVNNGIIVSTYARSVFLNGFMHWLEFSQIIAVDMDEKTWTNIQKYLHPLSLGSVVFMYC